MLVEMAVSLKYCTGTSACNAPVSTIVTVFFTLIIMFVFTIIVLSIHRRLSEQLYTV